MLISPEYLAAQRAMHERGNYGISGGKWALFADSLARDLNAESLLDYGCGSGLLRQALGSCADRRYQVLEYDPAVLGKETKPARADLVVCGDVMEHIEPEFANGVLDDIQVIAHKAVLFVIATQPAVKHLPDGRNAHLIVEPAEWWLPKLIERWRPDVFRNLGGEFLFVGKS